MAVTTTQTQSDPFKYQWARYVARRKLDTDRKVLTAKLSKAIPELAAADNVAELARLTLGGLEKLETLGKPPPVRGKFKVGIIGAGCAGLFTALILDWLHEVVPDLDISYDILEASGEERLGGRLYTHKFSKERHDYYDVGAMRFPDNDVMKRTFQLFDFLGLKKGEDLIKYYLKGHKCPAYFNDIRHVGETKGMKDPFEINSGLPKDDQIPPELLEQDAGDVVEEALRDFITKVKVAFEKRSREKKSSEEIWDLLMKADFMSARQFFRSTSNPGLPDGPGYNFNTIEWMETFAYATGWYNQSLTETVMELLDFKIDNPAEEGFWCIEGGTQRLATLMAAKLKKQPEFYRQVVAIDAHAKDPSNPGPMTLTIQQKHDCGGVIATEERDYYAVFNSTTLGAFQRMDLTKAGLLYGTKQAIRSLGYGASCKVGMKFKTRWWQKLFNINEGGTAKTDLPLRVCVYPSYNIGDDWDKPAVLLCSYTWAQDAQRIGTLITENSPQGERELKQLLFHDLALLHANKEYPYDDMMKRLEEQYITHHAYDWYADNTMSGAFAYFGPGQFSNMWPEIMKPNAFGQLYFVGEATSAHHAWIVGALESAVRGVYYLLDHCHNADEGCSTYVKAMEMLSSEHPGEHQLPFYPLPKEMPKRQEGVSAEEELADGVEDGKRLTFAAAQVVLGFLESLVELIEVKEQV